MTPPALPVPLTAPILALEITAAFLAGLVDAIGGGGGLISLPALLAAGLPAPIAIATNKGQAIFGATSSFATFWRRGGVDRAAAPLGFAAGFAGSCLGALALLAMRPEPLRPVVIALLLVSSVAVLIGRARRAGSPAGAVRRRWRRSRCCWAPTTGSSGRAPVRC
jgi:uncharacterized membrane protein YfcA